MNETLALRDLFNHTAQNIWALESQSFKNGSVYDDEMSRPFKNLIMFLCSVVFFVGVVGNLLVITVFGVRYRKLKNGELLMVNLAFADVLGGVFVPAQTIFELSGNSFSPIGDTGCQVLAWVSITSVTVSALTLLCISVDRFLVVKWPMRRRVEARKMIVVVATTWLISGCLGAPYFVNSRVRLTRYSVDCEVCRTFWKSRFEDRVHTIVVFLIQVLLPIACVSLLYPLIICELRGTSRRLFEAQSKFLKIRVKKQRIATFMLLVVLFAFYLFILPVNFFYVAYTFDGVHISNKSALVHTYFFLQVWALVNTSVNPLIYSKLHKSFRKHAVILIANCLGCRSKSSSLRSPNSFGTSVFSFSSRLGTSGLSIADSFRSSRGSPYTPATRAPLVRSDSASAAWKLRTGSLGSNCSCDAPSLRASSGDFNHNLHAQLLLRLQSSHSGSECTEN